MIRFLFNSLLFFLYLNSNMAFAITSAEITASTLKALPTNLHYKVRGFCSWMSPTEGLITTPYVEHYLPDLIVSVFSKPDDNPWLEINNTLDKAGEQSQQMIVNGLTGLKVGGGRHAITEPTEQAVFFKEVEILGNPGLSILPPQTLLTSTAVPLKPYYQSLLDSASWRGLPQAKIPFLEEAYALTTIFNHHIGKLPVDWGTIFPREGHVVSSNDAKAAAVLAQRAADLLTTSLAFGHIFQPLAIYCGIECQAAMIHENSEKIKFQMIYPIEEEVAAVFGKTISYGEKAETKTNGAYVWILWRHYEGCIQSEGKFIEKTIVG